MYIVIKHTPSDHLQISDNYCKAYVIKVLNPANNLRIYYEIIRKVNKKNRIDLTEVKVDFCPKLGIDR